MVKTLFFELPSKLAAELLRLRAIWGQLKTIGMNNNIHTVQSESFTFTLVSFDQGYPKNSQLQGYLADRNAIRRYFASILLFLSMGLADVFVSSSSQTEIMLVVVLVEPIIELRRLPSPARLLVAKSN